MAEHAERQIYRLAAQTRVRPSVCLFVCLSVCFYREAEAGGTCVRMLLIFCQIHKIGLAQTLIILSDVKKVTRAFSESARFLVQNIDSCFLICWLYYQAKFEGPNVRNSLIEGSKACKGSDQLF